MRTEYLRIQGLSRQRKNLLLQRTAGLLQRGEIVAFPTETVYGLGASIYDESALHALFRVKKRPKELPLPVLINLDQIRSISGDTSPLFQKLVAAFLPGPLTIVVRQRGNLSPAITGGRHTVAIRCSSHPIAQQLLRFSGFPIATSSANISSETSPTRAPEIFERFNGKIHTIIDGGEADYGIESTIISLETPERPTITRLGAISREEIERRIDTHVAMGKKSAS